MDDFSDINIVDTKEETDRKCPQCGGVMDFDPSTGNLKCPYCDYEEAIHVQEEAPKKAVELDFFAAEHTANQDWGAETRTVLCKACGAESIYDALQTSAVCPFCGSNQVMEANSQDTMAPGGVVPFQISDEQASVLFRTWIKRKWFCPKLAKNSAKPGRFKGIYLPYWTFDADTYSSYQGEYGIQHTREDSEGETYTETDWYRTSGTHNEFINDELVLASRNHDVSVLHKLEPFDTENNKTYKPEYIAGFVAERYSIGLKDAWNNAMDSIKAKLSRHISDQIRQENAADIVRNVMVTTDYGNITYKYLLLPIWISNFKYKDKIYQFMVNGQTGKIAGRTPLSIPKIVITAVAILVLLAIFFYIKMQN